MSENNSSSEITTKIRAAIKAKLTELGAYVDEELPDYIMVMIANKKSKQQMNEDLNLFLGKNSTTFTEWLQNVLDRLQSLSRSSSTVVQAVSQTVAASASAKEAKIASKASTFKEKSRKTSPERKKIPRTPSPRHRRERKPTLSKHRKRTTSKRGRHSSGDSNYSSTSNSEDDRKRKREEKKEIRKEETVKVEKIPAAVVETKISGKQKETMESHGKSGGVKRPTDEDILVVNAEVEEGDEMADMVTMPKEKSSQVATASSTSRPRTDHPQRTVTLIDSKPSQPIAQSQAPSVRKPIEAPSPDNYGRRHVGTVRPMKRRTPSPDEGPSRKRRSAIGQVIHHHEPHHHDDLNEEYDPLRPQLGLSSAAASSVASTVHVTERKYTVPREMQPKSSIFLRALNEANQSVKTRSRRDGNDDASRKETDDQRMIAVRNSDGDGDERTKYTRGVFSRISRDHLEEKEEPMDEARQNNTDDTKPMSRRIQLRQPKEEAAPQPEPESAESDVIIIDSATTVEKDGKKKEPTRFVVTMKGYDGGYERVVSKDESKTKKPEAPFYEEDTLIVDVDEDEMMEEAMMIYSARTGQHGQGPTPAMQVVNPITISLEDDEDDEDTVVIKPSDIVITSATPTGSNESISGSPRVLEEVSQGSIRRVSSMDAMAASKSLERCKYWPNCHQGETCHYQHPMLPCKNFPQCRFGDKCMYLHPQCKFDAYCKNPRCPYSHSATSSPNSYGMQPRFPAMVSQGPTAFIPCKFGGRCLNSACPYKHPQAPCMYGPSCTKPNCAYSHRQTAVVAQRPSVASRPIGSKGDSAKFRWVAPQTGANTQDSSKSVKSADPHPPSATAE